jgi:hypothetical protein
MNAQKRHTIIYKCVVLEIVQHPYASNVGPLSLLPVHSTLPWKCNFPKAETSFLQEVI